MTESIVELSTSDLGSLSVCAFLFDFFFLSTLLKHNHSVAIVCDGFSRAAAAVYFAESHSNINVYFYYLYLYQLYYGVWSACFL